MREHWHKDLYTDKAVTVAVANAETLPLQGYPLKSVSVGPGTGGAWTGSVLLYASNRDLTADYELVKTVTDGGTNAASVWVNGDNFRYLRVAYTHTAGEMNCTVAWGD